jgi:hypothetical protein
LPNVISYGGGFARPRILVGERVREEALGGLPEESELPDRTVNPDELPLGLLVPASGSGDHDDARAAAVERLRRRLGAAPPRPRGSTPRVLGQGATLLGWVLPQPSEEGIPLIANTREDYEVVRRLLTQHYAAFERNSDDDEVDDTDPTQKDFLFGALLREAGTLLRRDSLFATIWYGLALAWPRSSFVYRLFIRPPIALYDRLLSGPAARVADGYVALNHGLHHLIQYLCFLRGEAAEELTARASPPRLSQRSHQLLQRLKEPARGDERGALRATPRNRLRWLAQLFYPLGAPRRAARWAGGLALAVTLLLVALHAVRSAIAYHPSYLERLRPDAADRPEGGAPDGRAGAQ